MKMKAPIVTGLSGLITVTVFALFLGGLQALEMTAITIVVITSCSLFIGFTLKTRKVLTQVIVGCLFSLLACTTTLVVAVSKI